MTKLGIWTSKTGEKRVYISGFGQTKVWAIEQPADAFNCTLEIKAYNPNRSGSEIGNILNDAEKAINELAGKRVNSFDDLLKLAV